MKYEKSVIMILGNKVKIKEWAVDEGVVGKYFGKIGTIEAIEERNVTVVYEDGQKLFLFANELEVIECPTNKQSQN